LASNSGGESLLYLFAEIIVTVFGFPISMRDAELIHMTSASPTARLPEDHHRKTTFKDEFVDLLRKHEIEYDEPYIWD
jgi:hypothetical protein